MLADLWLDRWLPLVAERAGDLPVLELGCGSGRDTATLVRAGQRVVALDLSRLSLLVAKVRAPSATFYCRDLQAPFPVDQAGVVLASLSLHYFPWPETMALVERIRATLKPGGLLLCRLNSTRDENFGAVGHERIAENFYRVNGAPKRFFDRAAVEALFGTGWNTLSLREDAINRYALPKAVWEGVFERVLER